jgi:hypothetical protein
MRLSMSYWKAMQLFLSETGVHEVEVNSSSLKLRCNCGGFSLRKSCKHIRFVKNRMDDNDGVYPTEISKKASNLEAVIANQDPESFRKLLVTYGKIEVL